MVPGIVLAAGASTRMGRPKALLPVQASGQTFIERIIATLADGGVDEIVVVIGHEAQAIGARLRDMGPAVRVVRNSRYAEGQITSLWAALDVVDRPGVEAVLVTLVDVPLVSAATVRAILGRYEKTHALIVRPAHGSRHGHPVIFSRALFDEIRRADPAVGAKAVVHRHQREIEDVEVQDEGAFTDIDTPDDYVRHFGSPPAAAHFPK